MQGGSLFSQNRPSEIMRRSVVNADDDVDEN